MIRDGVRYVRARPDLMLILAIVFFAGTFGLNFQMTSALMATQVFHKGAGGVRPARLRAWPIGSLAGALLAARRGGPAHRLVVVCRGALRRRGDRRRPDADVPHLRPGPPAARLHRADDDHRRQRHHAAGVAPAMRGRVMALYMMVFMGGTPIGSPIIGWLGEHFGARWTLIAGGLLVIAGTAFATLLFTRRKGIVVRPKLEPHPHMHVYGRREYAELRS